MPFSPVPVLSPRRNNEPTESPRDIRTRPARDKVTTRKHSPAKPARAVRPMPPTSKPQIQSPRPLPQAAPAVRIKTVSPAFSAPRKPVGPSVASLTDGQQVTHLGPFRYDPAAIAKCTGACVVPFSGPGGGVVGRFFKAGFGEAFTAHKGSAYLSGIVRQNGGSTTILIQNVE